MKSLLTILVLFLSISIQSQSTINGIVTNQNGVAIVGANVYLEGTYDGSTTDDEGNFRFSTSETGSQTLIVSYLSYETFTMLGDISLMKDLK